MLKIVAWFLIVFGTVLVLLGALQYFYLRTTAPVLFPGRATTVGVFCMALGGLFSIIGIIMAVWLWSREKRWPQKDKEKGKG